MSAVALSGKKEPKKTSNTIPVVHRIETNEIIYTDNSKRTHTNILCTYALIDPLKGNRSTGNSIAWAKLKINTASYPKS